MKYKLEQTLIFILLLFVLSCKRNNAEDGIVTPPSQLAVEVALRASTSASIKWAHTGVVNESTTRYRVMLDGVVYQDNLTGSATEITGLKANIEYKGKLIAYNSSGELATAAFILDAVNGYIIYGGPLSRVFCNQISSGAMAWSYDDGAYAASPAIAGDTLFIYTDRTPISALNLHTGKLIWRVTGYSSTIDQDVSLLYHKNTVYATTSRGVEAYNSSTGAFEWKYTSNDLSWSNTNDPVIADNLLIIGSQLHLLAIDLDSHQMAWVYDAKVHMIQSPVVYKNRVIFSDHAGFAYGLNARTGQEVWIKELKKEGPNATGTFPIAPVISGELVIVNAPLSGYYALNANTGALLWKTSHEYGAGAAAGGGMVFYIYEKGPFSLVAVNALNGKIIWEKTISSPYNSIDPIYANGKLYVAGQIYNALNGTFLGSMGNTSYWSTVVVDKGIPYYQAKSGMAN